jgi:CRP-like cAMP-binding protein
LESIGSQVAFSPGDRVFTEGEPGKGVYILRSGSARVSMESHDGHIIELRTLQPGSFIGLSSTLSCDHCCYTVETGELSEFIFVPAPHARELLRLRPDLCLQVIQLLGQEMSSICNERARINVESKPVRIVA